MKILDFSPPAADPSVNASRITNIRVVLGGADETPPNAEGLSSSSVFFTFFFFFTRQYDN